MTHLSNARGVVQATRPATTVMDEPFQVVRSVHVGRGSWCKDHIVRTQVRGELRFDGNVDMGDGTRVGEKWLQGLVVTLHYQQSR